MPGIIQTSCSELLVDTAIHKPEVALERFNALFKECGWESSPPLTLQVLKDIKEDRTGYRTLYGNVIVYDKDGNRATLEYGDNGYVTTGYRLDASCNHGDIGCFPIFRGAIERLNGELISCDGGSTGDYERWACGEGEEE